MLGSVLLLRQYDALSFQHNILFSSSFDRMVPTSGFLRGALLDIDALERDPVAICEACGSDLCIDI